MRVVGGRWRGRELKAPIGRDTRPTTDRMRESLASMIMSARGLDLEGCSVLDAFAGSGGMGIELLSRGASHCTFCERNRKAAAVVRQNCRALDVPSSLAHVVCDDAMRLCKHDGLPGAPFDLVFLDPPYAMPAQSVGELVMGLDAAALLAESCLVVYEHASSAEGLELEEFDCTRSKRHGASSIDVYERKERS